MKYDKPTNKPTNGNISSVDFSFSCCTGNFPLYIAHDVKTTSALDDNLKNTQQVNNELRQT